ncbi:MAG TPA: hypothetical protein VK501_14890 [Baekduia sp.]|uniref:hypothetical protein n=1 Tax=Baekduia sp. TaxID=2600305 RepID=UPI002C8BE746|nr:hypothetical protein [Baekduia sp.]HMJ35195.1 hypothetical protein [Baekduia sp.]
MTRLQLAAILAWILAASAALVELGLSSWSPLAQLIASISVLIGATLIAPGYFGWRDPRRHH